MIIYWFGCDRRWSYRCPYCHGGGAVFGRRWGAPPYYILTGIALLATCYGLIRRVPLEYLAVSRDHSCHGRRGALDEGGLNCWALMPRLGVPLGRFNCSLILPAVHRRLTGSPSRPASVAAIVLALHLAAARPWF